MTEYLYKLSRSSEGRWLTYTITQNLCTRFKIKPLENSDPFRVLFIYLFELYCRLLVPLLSTWALIPLCNTPNPRDSRRYWARISQWIPARA